MKLNTWMRAALATAMLVSFSLTFSACCNCGNDEAATKQLEKDLDKSFEKKTRQKNLPPKKGAKKITDLKKKTADIKKKVAASKKKTAEIKKKTEDIKAKIASLSENKAVRAITPKALPSKIRKLGWKLIKKPSLKSSKGNTTMTLSVKKGKVGGAVAFNDFKSVLAAKAYQETGAKNKDASVARDGNKVIMVITPGNKAEGEKLLNGLLK